MGADSPLGKLERDGGLIVMIQCPPSATFMHVVEFTNNVQPGQATVKLTGIGNFTGTRETSFRILNIAGGGGSSSSGGGGGNYSYDGFDDGEGEDEDEEEDENVGHLIINGVDYGTILFNAEGIPAPFVQFEEPVEQALPEGEATDEASDEATGETAYLVGEVIAAADPEAKGKVVYTEGGAR